MTEASGATAALRKRLYELEVDLPHGHDHELRDALPRLNTERRGPTVSAGDQQFPLVVGIDQADEITEDDSVFMPES